MGVPGPEVTWGCKMATGPGARLGLAVALWGPTLTLWGPTVTLWGPAQLSHWGSALTKVGGWCWDRLGSAATAGASLVPQVPTGIGHAWGQLRGREGMLGPTGRAVCGLCPTCSR